MKVGIPKQSLGTRNHWDAGLYASITEPELFYASGGSTVTSTGTFTITKSASGMVNVTGSVVHSWHDPYDWHAGLGAPVPGFGNVSDEDALCLVAAGMAKEFDMSSSWTQNLTYSSSSGTYSWSKP